MQYLKHVVHYEDLYSLVLAIVTPFHHVEERILWALAWDTTVYVSCLYIHNLVFSSLFDRIQQLWLVPSLM